MNVQAPTSTNAANTWANLDSHWRVCVYAFGITIALGACAAVASNFMSNAKGGTPAASPFVTESPLKVLTKPQELYDLELKAMEEKYPELNQASPMFQKDLYAQVMSQMKVFEKQGLSPSRSLLRSADLIMGKHRAAQIMKANRAAKEKNQMESQDSVAPAKLAAERVSQN